MIHSEKFVHKYMRLARQLGTDNNPCHSRQLGAVIVDQYHKIKGAGYNGPPAGTPHCDDPHYLRNFFWPKLTENERESIRLMYGCTIDQACDSFVRDYGNCGSCPRKLVKAKSGQRLELCSCQHAERNAIYNAGDNVVGCVMYAWCPTPCVDCAGAIINTRIAELHCLVEKYDSGSLYLLKQANVAVHYHEESDLV